MTRIRYTLLTDGSSDRLLRYPIDWLLDQVSQHDFDGRWADPDIYRPSKGASLGQRIEKALRHYPCDLLLVHRDAEKQPREKRVAEIQQAILGLGSVPPAVCVVPVRMTEAWLLIDETALREAASNPKGKVDLELPALSKLEAVPNAKQMLFDLLLEAAEGVGRRRSKFKRRLYATRQRLAELIDDYSPLDNLPAFAAFRGDLQRILSTLDPAN